jgi:thiol:disulfide interchange protein
MSGRIRRTGLPVIMCVGMLMQINPVQANDIAAKDAVSTISIRYKSATEFVIDLGVHSCCYIYQDSVKLYSKRQSAEIFAEALTRTISHTDEYFGDVEIYREQASYSVKTKSSTGHPPPKRFDMVIEYRACADIGICFLPEQKTLRIENPFVFE